MMTPEPEQKPLLGNISMECTYLGGEPVDVREVAVKELEVEHYQLKSELKQIIAQLTADGQSGDKQEVPQFEDPAYHSKDEQSHDKEAINMTVFIERC